MPRLLAAPVLLALALVVTACGTEPATQDSARVDAARETLLYWTSVLDDEAKAELAAVAPNVRFVTGLSKDDALARADEFHGADAHLLTPEFLARATNLRWVQSWSAGVDRYLGLDGLMENDAIAFTNMKGAHGPVISEHVFALLLHLRRDLAPYLAAQRAGTWKRGAGEKQRALAGDTLLVAGMGGIGREIAKRGKAFGMEVLATVRTPRRAPAYVDELGTAEDLDRFLARADVVAIALPLTPETRGLFDAARIGRMKKGAMLINIARGGIVDTEALVAALRSGHLAGAGLDVTDPEPLPAGHVLWSLDNVVITPHVAGRAELTLERRMGIFRENAMRFGAGRPLHNVVDKQAGY